MTDGWYAEIPAEPGAGGSSASGPTQPGRRRRAPGGGRSPWWALVVVVAVLLVIVAIVVRPSSGSSGGAPASSSGATSERGSTAGTDGSGTSRTFGGDPESRFQPSFSPGGGRGGRFGAPPSAFASSAPPAQPGVSTTTAVGSGEVGSTFSCTGGADCDCPIPPGQDSSTCMCSPAGATTGQVCTILPPPSLTSGASSSPSTAAPPSTVAHDATPIAGETGWRLLVVFGDQLAEIDPRTGTARVSDLSALTTSQTNPLQIGEVGGVLGNTDWAMVWLGPDGVQIADGGDASGDGVPVGLLIRPGEPAAPLTASFEKYRAVLPGPTATTLWAESATGTALTPVDLSGRPVGSSITLPPGARSLLYPGVDPTQASSSESPDGRGGVLAVGTGGTYDITTSGIKQLSPSQGLLAAGPAGTLVSTCGADGACRIELITPAGKAVAVPGNTNLVPCASPAGGVVSADGSHAAVCLQPDPARPGAAELLDLKTGKLSSLPDQLAELRTIAVFSPDGKYLLEGQNGNIAVYSVADGHVVSNWSFPGMEMLSIASGGL